MIGDRSALKAANIEDAALRAAYLHGRHLLMSAQGRSYWVVSLLAPSYQRAYSWSIYAFARHTDDLVDRGDQHSRHARLDEWESSVHRAIESGHAHDQPLLAALLHTMQVCDIDRNDVFAQLRGHRRALTTIEFPTYASLQIYIDEVACAFGRMLLPILGPANHAAARSKMDQLLAATQLTDILQDLAVDLSDGRLYIPHEDLVRHGVERGDLQRGTSTDAIRSLVRAQVVRVRGLLESSADLTALLRRESRPGVAAVRELTEGVIRTIERRNYDIVSQRPDTSSWSKIGVVSRMARRAALARLHSPKGSGERLTRGPL